MFVLLCHEGYQLAEFLKIILKIINILFVFKENTTCIQSELEKQQERVATLSASLATVMQQKSKMEASYQADKKKMMV